MQHYAPPSYTFIYSFRYSYRSIQGHYFRPAANFSHGGRERMVQGKNNTLVYFLYLPRTFAFSLF